MRDITEELEREREREREREKKKMRASPRYTRCKATTLDHLL